MQIDHHSNTQDGCHHMVKDPAPMWTQEGHHKIASREAPGLQGREIGGNQPCRGGPVRGSQACRGGQLGANRLAGEQLDINQAGMGVVRG